MGRPRLNIREHSLAPASSPSNRSSNYTELAKAAARNPQINPVRAAIGDKRGKLNIRLNPENSQAHSFKWAPGDQAEIVDLVTIDEFCLERKLCPDFMKIDAEGYDLKVIAGAKQILANPIALAVLIEATLNFENEHCIQLSPR